MTHGEIDTSILNLIKERGEIHSKDIIASMPDINVNTLKKRISKLKRDGKIAMPRRSVYTLTSASTLSLNADRKQIENELRAADANKDTIDRLLNIYDTYLDNYEDWVKNNIGPHIDFEKQLLCIENFKWLTGIGDKLMKRWSLEHVGYDTNTRQAQEDAKAKTAEREKAALEDAPLEEQVNVLGSFDLDTKQLIDNLPTLESLTEEEAEDVKV